VWGCEVGGGWPDEKLPMRKAPNCLGAFLIMQQGHWIRDAKSL
jgi:hypothetical protein